MRRIRTVLLCAASGLIFGWGMPAYAQDAEPADEPTAEEVVEEAEDEAAREDTIVVTGSRLRRDAFTSASPIQVVEGEQARDLGLIDAADMVQQTTVVQGVQFDTGLSTSAGVNPTDVSSGPGSATVGLRGLSAGRTLTLVNGRRLSPAGVRGAPSSPDANLIPGSLVERIEILLDGASSIYGSDAVAGVVNYILRKDFDGLELDAYYTVPEMGDMAGQQQLYSAHFGRSNDRGYVSFAAEWTQTQEATFKDMADFDPEKFEFCPNRIFSRDASGRVFNSLCGNGAIGSRLLFGPFIIFRDPAANEPGLPPGYRQLAVTSTVLTAGDPAAADLLLHPEDQGTFFHPEFERLTLYSTGEYDTGLYGNLTAYFEASHSKRDSLDVTHGQGSIPIPADFVANPFPGFSYVLFYRSDVRNETTVDQTRLIGGFKGDLPFMNDTGFLKDWYYDVYASYSRSDGFDRVQGLMAANRYRQFVETATISPATGELACEPVFVADDFGQDFPVLPCVAADLFDPFFLDNGRFQDPDANRYFFPNRMERTIFEQTTVSGYVAGTFTDLPAGPLKGLIGVEFRDDEIETQVDGATSEGEFDDDTFADRGASGSRALLEVFFELEAPIVTGKRFMEELSVNAAARWTEEEFFGAYWTYAFRGQYKPFDWLRFRGTYGTSFRAPDVGEQFGSQLLGNSDFRGAGDPCLAPGIAFDFVDHDNDPNTAPLRVYDPNLDPRSQTVLDNCSNGGGPFGFPSVDPTVLGTIGAGTNNLAFLGIAPLVAEGSNPNLEPETSKSWTVGVVLEQPWFDSFDFRLAATYYNILVENQVVELSEVEVVTTCYEDEGLDDPLCNFMSRSSLTGFVDFVNAQLQNIGELTAKGVDINVAGGFDFGIPNVNEQFRFDFIANATRSLENNETLVTETDEQLSEHGFPEWRANFTGILSWKDLALLWRTRFVDSTIEDTTDPIDESENAFDECVREGDLFPANADAGPHCIFVDNTTDYWVHDLSLTFTRDTWKVRAGINNVFDTIPPNANVNFRARGLGYDLFGRTYFFNVTKKF